MTGDIWMGRELDGKTSGSPHEKLVRIKLTQRKHMKQASAVLQRKTGVVMNPETKDMK